MISVQKKLKNSNNVLAAWCFDTGMSIGLKNSGDRKAEAIVIIEQNDDGTVKLRINEDKLNELNGTIVYGNSKEDVELTEKENCLVRMIDEAKRFVVGELEIDLIKDCDNLIPGWYARDYRWDLGGAFELNHHMYRKPLITCVQADEFNVDVRKCIEYCNVMYVG